MRRRAIALPSAAAAVAALFAATVARTQSSPPLDLEWTAPPSCPSRERVLADIARMVKTSDPRARVRARVTITQDASTYRADLVIDEGTRSLSADRCDALSDAAALIVALAIDPTAKPLPAPAVVDAGAPADASTSTATSISTLTPTSTSAPADAGADTSTSAAAGAGSAADAASAVPSPSTSPPGPPLVHLAAEAALDSATLPKVAIAPAAALGLRMGTSARAEAFGALLFEQTTEVAPSGIGARVSGFVAGARGAYLIGAGDLAIGPSAGLAMHVLRATAFGATTSGSGSANWLGVLLGGQATYALDPSFALRADVAADLALSRPEFVIENFQTIHRPGALSVCAGLGAELRFF